MTDMLIFVTIATISTSIDNSTAIPKAITISCNCNVNYAIPDLTTPGRPIPAQGEMAICSGKRVITYFYNS